VLHILGMGYSCPETIIDNKFIEDLDIGTSDEWIMSKIGIEERRSSLPIDYIKSTRNINPEEGAKVASTNATELGVKAVEMACSRAGISTEQIGLIICNCCTPADVAPAESQRIAHALNLKCQAYDLFSACPAFALHMDFINNFDESLLPEYVVCVSTAVLTQNVNYNDRSDAAIWGDGAAAWVVSGVHMGPLKVLDTAYTTDPTRSEAVVVDTFGHFHQDGRAVRDFSVRQTVRLVKQLEDQYGLDWERDIFIGHQANRTMLGQITNNRKIPESSHWHNVTHIGNQAGAGAPATLAMHWDDLKKGQRIVVAVVGAGLSWGSVLMEVVEVH